MNGFLSFSIFFGRFNNKYTNVLLLLLLSADIAFAALTVFEMTTPFLHSYLYSSLMDGSYAEMYQYLKWLWIVILLILFAARNRSFGFYVWIFIFIYILIDDSFQIHERFGRIIAENLSVRMPLSIEAQNLGELFISSAVGIILGSLFLLSHFSGKKEYGYLSLDLLFLFLCLIFFGVVLDIGKDFFHLSEHLDLALSLVEDTGEMIVGSVIVWYLFFELNTEADSRPYILDFIRTKHPENR